MVKITCNNIMSLTDEETVESYIYRISVVHLPFQLLEDVKISSSTEKSDNLTS